MTLTRSHDQAAYIRPFLVAVVLALFGEYVWWLLQGALFDVGPRPIGQAVGIGAVLMVHGALHWNAQYIGKRWLPLYLFVQNVLIFIIGISGRNGTLIPALNLPLIGEMLVIFESLGWSLAVEALFMGVSLLSYLITNGPAIIYPVAWSDVLSAIVYIPYYGALFLQVRSRRHAQDLLNELDAAHRQLAIYAEQVEQLTLSAERARMARELHDTLAQGVAGIVLQLEALSTYLERGDLDKSNQIVLQAKDRARSALTDSRRAIDDLRIMPDRADAILDAIRDEADRFSAATGIPCKLTLPPTLTLQTSVMEHTIRCTSEALSNIARHARAKHVFIDLKVTLNQLMLQVRDDGIGFDTVGTTYHGHYGLLGLRERARLVGGTLDVESAVGTGTTIRLYCPIVRPEAVSYE